MLSVQTALSFAVVSFAIAVSPGPSWAFVIAATAGQNRYAGFMAVLGNATGILMHVLIAAMGLTLLLKHFSGLYLVLKWLGAAYLIYLAFCIVRARFNAAYPGLRDRRHMTIYGQGVLVNLLNPKMLVLMVALMPPFLDDAGPITMQVFALGMIHVAMASLLLSTIVLSLQRVQAQLAASSHYFERTIRWFSGLLIFVFAILMFFKH